MRTVISFLVSLLVFAYGASAVPLSIDWRQPAGGAPSAVVNILDASVLNALEQTGFSLAEVLGGSKPGSQTADLYKNSRAYQSFADILGRPLEVNPKTDQLPDVIPPNQGDIPDIVRWLRNFEDRGKRSEKDIKGGYYIRHLSNNSQYPYTIEYDGDEPRHFDYRWLNSKFGFMKLIAVVNRMDRVDFDADSCGEVRFVYRLSYQSPKSSSSLPFFINVVRRYPKKESCEVFAKKWVVDSEQSSVQFASYLKENVLKNTSFKQLEVNFQTVRFTSGYMHDFGGQAMYLLRIFKMKGDQLEPIELENTPNVLEIEKNPELLKKFVEYLKKGNNLERLDQGILVVDFNPQFLAKQAISWSTLGRARSANKPYSRLFEGRTDLLTSIDISKLKFIKSHEALVERLNNLTCMGCHQSGGTAGFHMLGFADDKFSHGFNRQELPLSPHAFSESIRRKAYVNKLLEGKKPNTFRPHSNFPLAAWMNETDIPKFETVTTGSLCLLDKKQYSVTPICRSDSTCQKSVDSNKQNVLFGECVKTAMPFAGSACWKGEILEERKLPSDRGPIMAYNLFAFQDKWKLKGSLSMNKDYKCVLPQSGAPLGRSSRPCSVDEENLTKIKVQNDAMPVEVCGNQGGNGFDLCAATGDSGSCLESRVVRSMLDVCYAGRFCREDYICQRLPEYHKISEVHYFSKKDGKRVNKSSPKDIDGGFIKQAHEQHVGFCVPTYFLFNMRLDGHPSPVTGLPPGDPKVDRSQPVRGYN